jgi:phage repressor protein C with HTH and peptisase S24 domain
MSILSVLSMDINKSWFSAAELAALGQMSVIKVPRSERRAGEKARRLGWEEREVLGKGGKGGVKTEYQPPGDILVGIHKFLSQNPDFFSETKASHEKTIRHESQVAKPRLDTPQPPNDFVLVPRYDVQGSAGHGSIVHSEQIVDHLAFRTDWVKNTLGVTEKDLVLISVKGDSMEPTLSNDDLILVNIQKGRIEDNAVYVLQHDGDLLVKRIQRKMDGALIIKSDNPLYEQEVLDSSQAESLHVLGRVVWYGRKM